MSEPKSDYNFNVLPDGNIKVRDLDACTDEQREFFFERLEDELMRLWLIDQSKGQN